MKKFLKGILASSAAAIFIIGSVGAASATNGYWKSITSYNWTGFSSAGTVNRSGITQTVDMWVYYADNKEIGYKREQCLPDQMVYHKISHPPFNHRYGVVSMQGEHDPFFDANN